MNQRTRRQQSDIREEHERVRALAQLQQELRSILVRRREEDDLTIGTFARRLGVGWGEVREFLDGKRAICGGRILTAMATYIGRPEFCYEITSAARELSDRVRGLAVGPLEAVDCAFALTTVHTRDAPELTQEEFAALFSDAAPRVLHILQCSLDELQGADGAELRRSIDDALADRESLLERIATVRDGKRSQQAAHAEALEQLLRQLQSQYPTVQERATALGVHRVTLTKVLRGTAAPASGAALIAKAHALLSGRAATPAEVDVTPEPTPPNGTSPARALDHFGGETSGRGVRFVLGPESFRELEGDPGADGVAFTRRQLELARLALHLCVQLKDAAVRRRIQEELRAEVEELELAIRLFSERYPNRLLELHSAQRALWDGITSQNSSPPHRSQKRRES